MRTAKHWAPGGTLLGGLEETLGQGPEGLVEPAHGEWHPILGRDRSTIGLKSFITWRFQRQSGAPHLGEDFARVHATHVDPFETAQKSTLLLLGLRHANSSAIRRFANLDLLRCQAFS